MWLEGTLQTLFTRDTALIAVLSFVTNGTGSGTISRCPTSGAVETLLRRWFLAVRPTSTRLKAGACTLGIRVTHNFRTQRNVNGSTTTVRDHFARFNDFARRLLRQILQPTGGAILTKIRSLLRCVLSRCTGDTIHRTSIVRERACCTRCFWAVCTLASKTTLTNFCCLL